MRRAVPRSLHRVAWRVPAPRSRTTQRASPVRPRVPLRWRCSTAAPARRRRADRGRSLSDTPISAYDGVVAWSVIRLLHRPLPARHPPRDAHRRRPRSRGAARPFDVSLGPDSQRPHRRALHALSHGEPRLRRLPLRPRERTSERKLVSVSSPSLDEAWPAQWRGRITFARRARTHVIDGFDHRPDPRGRGPVLAATSRMSRRSGSSRARAAALDRSAVRLHDGMAIRGDDDRPRDRRQPGRRRLGVPRPPAAGRAAARRWRLARAGGGEGGYSPFSSASLSAAAVLLTRTGQRQGVAARASCGSSLRRAS